MSKRFLLFSAALPLVSLGLAPGAMAQQAASDPVVTTPVAAVEEADDEAIVITGSRIRQSNTNSSVPIQIVDSVQIELTGETNVGDIIRNLPAAGVSAITPANSNFAVSGSGITTVNLRNLGEDRTLVLVNGRRFVAGLPGSQIVDFNAIPTDFIERLDVITGGASAVYGSDALAGAVNIILKKNFQGVSISGQLGQVFKHNDNQDYSVRITAGSSFDGGKGNAIFNVSWNRNDGVLARDRTETAIDCTNLAFFTGDPADFRDCFTPTLSSFPPNTRIIVPAANRPPATGLPPVGGTTVNRVIDPATGAVRPFVSAQDGFNRNGIRALSTPLERILLSSTLNYEVTPWAKFFFEGTYSRTQATSELEPFPLGSDSVFDGFPNCSDINQNGLLDTCDLATGVPLSSGVVPAALRASVLAANPELNVNTAVVGFARRLSEVGNRGADSLRQTFRVVIGTEGDLTPFTGELFEDLSYEASFNYGTTTDNQVSGGQLNVSNLREAFNITTDPITGQTSCANPVAVAEGCAPVFIFGENTIGQDALDYIRAPVLRDARITQLVASASVSGHAIKIPTGDAIGFSFGTEYRNEQSRDTPDALTQTGQNAGNLIAEQIGGYNVIEGFGEIEVPLLVNQFLAKSLTFHAAARVANYSTVGTNVAWSVGADWAINDWARIRGQFSRAVRAPNIGELFSTGGETFASVTDPCAGVTVNSAGAPAFFNTRVNINDPNAVLASGIDATTVNSVLAQNCLADAAIANRVSSTGGFAITQAEFQGTGGFVGGSPPLGTLTEERSRTFSVGGIFTPRTGISLIDSFSVSADYYNIVIRDALGAVGRQLSLNECYSATALSFGAGNQFCANINRFAVGPQIGSLDEVNGGVLNIASLQTSGIDFQLSQRIGLNEFGIGKGLELGDILLSATYTYLLEQQSETFGTVTNARTFPGTSNHRVLANFVYTRGPLTFNWETTILSGVDVDVFATEDRLGHLPTQTFSDLQLRYKLPKGLGTLVLGVDNILDRYVIVGGTNGDIGSPTGSRTFPNTYEPFGRAWYTGLRFDF